MSMIWVVLALVGIGLAVSLPATWLALRIGRRIGALDSAGAPGHQKVLRPVPNTGGIGIFVGVAIPLLVGCAVLAILPASTLESWVPTVGEHLNRLRGEGTGGSLATAAALLLGLTVLHVIGLIDDRRGLGPFLKLAVQGGIALVLAVFFNVRLLELLGPVPSVVITVGWILVITNAINFLDNMDGLAGGVSAIAAAFLMAATIINHQWFIAATLALLIGSLLGFLIWNFPPARVFMGDGGSLVVGFLLAVLTARTTFYHGALGGGWYGVFMPVVVLAIPLYDFTSVTLIRLRQGKSPFVGDQQHFSHRLVQRGLSKRGAVIVIWCFAAITGIGGIALGHLELWQAILVLVQTLLVLLTLALLEHASRGRVQRPHDPT